MNNKIQGTAGEQEVIERIHCPNCESKLMLLPPSFPLYDVQCTRCIFRAQVKTNNSKPKKSILGAGWEIYDKVLKTGHLAPPLITNFKWKSKEGLCQEIIFYPFIAKNNIQKYILSETAQRANYPMFRYINLDKIPSMMLYDSKDSYKNTPTDVVS